ncbi:putative palmitoyltransferase ZDHHC16 [Grifola frondosa]|uniref:Palmitoyltransferase n=1 Tax=Grifola frondosa TaxID=5627 RepID=A0A1C7LPM3_GRIFR|nr:putative palmitoyltransferase ZDHHC16 [Grifola frondosa]
MIYAKQVFRCFKWLERLGDRLTGAAGPVFVSLAVILLSIGVVCFFEIVQPSLPLCWLSTPICVLIAVNMFMHYFYVCTITPGFVLDPPRQPGSGLLWAKKRKTARNRTLTGVRWSEYMHITKASVTKCNRCGEMRPERSHHCRIWINQCVGLHNERHFVLFLVYLDISAFCFAIFGWRHVLLGLGWFDEPWTFYSPPMAFILTYILAVVIFLAVLAMTGWHLWMVASGETSVESQDYEHYRKLARGRGETFVNCYDLGKGKNLEAFFNIGTDGYPFYTLILPLRIMPYTDGHHWARKEGYESHRGVRRGEELTDEDDE